MRFGLCIPVKKPGAFVEPMVAAINAQTRRPDKILVIDSGHGEGETSRYTECGAEVLQISPEEFDHGETRNIALRSLDVDVCMFLTQDAIPARPDTFANLLRSLEEDERVAVAYGRQMPGHGAGPFARHHRMYNYPDVGGKRTIDDARRLGIRAAFCSNSFAAYRRSAMEQIGWFPRNTIWGEDTIAAARLLAAGWAVAYVAEAVVSHSHDFSLKEEFGRYFDAGVFHATERWYREMLGRAEGEGFRFLRSELRYFIDNEVPFAVGKVIIRNAVRWLGYRTGLLHWLVPRAICRAISHNKAYWSQKAVVTADGRSHVQ